MVTLKKKTFGYNERCEKEREKFIKKLKTIKPEDIIYSDESGMDDNDVNMEGWSMKGERLHDTKKSQRTDRISFIAALNLKKLIAPFVFEGSCTRDVFETYLKEVLVPVLTPGKVLIIDNASFHKGGRIKKIIKAAGCKILYLPTYSPDFNPIEHCWAFIKGKIRKLLTTINSNIYEVAISVFESVVI